MIRPGKSLLGLFYVDHRSLWLDLQLCVLTAVAIVSRPHALQGVQGLLRQLGAPEPLVEMAGRQKPLVPQAPPGSDSVVTSRG